MNSSSRLALKGGFNSLELLENLCQKSRGERENHDELLSVFPSKPSHLCVYDLKVHKVFLPSPECKVKSILSIQFGNGKLNQVFMNNILNYKLFVYIVMFIYIVWR